MNLFGGKENYVLQSFKALSSDNAGGNGSDLPLFSITLSKVHDTIEGLGNVENNLSVHEFTDQQVQVVVLDNYKADNEAIALYVEGVGRFNIQALTSREKTYQLFKKTVIGVEYFNLEVKIIFDPILNNKSGKVLFTDYDLSFKTNFNCASFNQK